MPLLSILIVLLIIGVVLWFINAYVPMPKIIKTILNVIVVIVVVWWLLSIFGLVSHDLLNSIKHK